MEGGHKEGDEVKKLPVSHYVKNLKLIERNTEWLSADNVSPRLKLSYYVYIFLTYATRSRSISYLGSKFHFDNSATPLNLQNYPHEITAKILANMHRPPKTVLDIGGNLGQFSLTMHHVLKGKVKIDSFEPNSFVYDFLQKNVAGKKSINIFNYGLGEKNDRQTLYFNPTRTGIGSLIKQNAGLGADKSQSISITAHPEKLTKRSKYDLVKIDVEGYEIHVLKGLAGITFEYLFIELSGQGRKKDYNHSELMDILRSQWGQFDIYYASSFGRKNDTFDMLVRFK